MAILLKLAVVMRLLRELASRTSTPLMRIPAVAALKTRWQATSRFKRALIVNMLICATLTLAVEWGGTTRWLQPMGDSAMDWALNIRANTDHSVAQGRSAPFVIIDIDDDTQEAWGAPPFIDREKLAAILDKILSARPAPKVVVVDVAMGRRKGIDMLPMLNMLEKHVRDTEMPPLVLIRDLRRPAQGDDCPIPRESELDELAASAPGRIFWASPLFTIDEDHVVRRWHGFVQTTEGVLPGVENITHAVVAGNATTVAPLNSAALGCTPSPQGSSLSRRILFAISQRPKSRPYVDGAPILETISAQDLGSLNPDAAPGYLGGKIVIIGASYADARDTHQTPLGPMPGSLIIANAVHSQLTFGEAHLPSLLENLLIQAVLVTLIGALFARFNSFVGMALSAAAVMALLAPLGLILFDKGVWLNFALPTVVVQIHQVVAEFRERVFRKESKPT